MDVLCPAGADLEALVRKYSDALVRYARCIIIDPAAAEDLAEDAFVVLLIKKRHFPDEAHLRAFLYKVVKNRCMSYLRAKKRFAPLDEQAVRDNIAELLDQRQTSREVRHAVASLSPDYRDVLILCYFEGFGVAECAEILKRSPKQIYNLLARAKIALRNTLSKEALP